MQNAKTRVSCAVTHLLADIRYVDSDPKGVATKLVHRWCLTGTPLINGLTDAYGMLRFVQHRPMGVRYTVRLVARLLNQIRSQDWDRFKELLRHNGSRKYVSNGMP